MGLSPSDFGKSLPYEFPATGYELPIKLHECSALDEHLESCRQTTV